ncbi:MAG: 2-dehydro-3-deoxygalactonokinase [Mesorhizobium amorphae]|nr:MAG: 2-dehydro-3-deoxygalactonokinase [Mesorhizobium amorphae]
MSAAFALADWGSSHLRIWLCDGEGRVLGERRSADGMLAAGGRFAAVLEAHLEAFGAAGALPVFACGMVGARQGWVEAPYVAVPATLDAVFGAARRVEGVSRPVLILPGLSQAEPADVMRGEETQLAGLQAEPGSCTVCLPGTHSKWAEMKEGRITRFASVPTGELFAVLGQHSILRHSLGTDDTAVDPGAPAFRQACADALSDGDAIARLFGIRAASLLHGLEARDAAARLSGLLIGAELFAMRRRFTAEPVVLLASGAMARLYRSAFEVAGIAIREADADAAVRRGLVEAARHHRELWI